MNTLQKIGRYEIIEELGRGAMGAVYRAKDPAMDRIVALHPADLHAVVQAGVMRESLNRAAGAHGLFFPVDPGTSACTLGGNHTQILFHRQGRQSPASDFSVELCPLSAEALGRRCSRCPGPPWARPRP